MPEYNQVIQQSQQKYQTILSKLQKVLEEMNEFLDEVEGMSQVASESKKNLINQLTSKVSEIK